METELGRRNILMKDMSGVSSVEKEPGKLISADDVQEISPN